MTRRFRLLRNVLFSLVAYVGVYLLARNFSKPVVIGRVTWFSPGFLYWWLCSIPNYFIAKEIFNRDYEEDRAKYWIKYFIFNGALFTVFVLVVRLLHPDVAISCRDALNSFYIAWFLYFSSKNYNTASLFFTGVYAIKIPFNLVDFVMPNYKNFDPGQLIIELLIGLAFYLKHRSNEQNKKLGVRRNSLMHRDFLDKKGLEA